MWTTKNTPIKNKANSIYLKSMNNQKQYSWRLWNKILGFTKCEKNNIVKLEFHRMIPSQIQLKNWLVIKQIKHWTNWIQIQKWMGHWLNMEQITNFGNIYNLHIMFEQFNVSSQKPKKKHTLMMTINFN